MDVDEELHKAVAKVSGGAEAYTKAVLKFRSDTKNDIVSISASAAKIEAQCEKMHQAYSHAVTLLTSAEMELAIANAERLAKALESIAALKSNSITFAVLDTKPNAAP